MTVHSKNDPSTNGGTVGGSRPLLAGCVRFILLSLVILVGAAAIFAGNAEFILFRNEVYLQAFEDIRLYERFPGLIAPQLAAQVEAEAEEGAAAEDMPHRGVFQYLTADDYQAMVLAVVTPEWVRDQANRALDPVLGYLNLETPELRPVLSMVDVKSRLRGEAGQEILQRILASWPACTMSQLVEMAASGLNGTLDGFPVCRPPAEYVPMITPALEEGLRQTVADIPNEMDLIQPPFRFSRVGEPEPETPGLDPLNVQDGPAYPAFRWSIRLAPLAALAALALLTLASVRSLLDVAVWWGLSLAGAGALALATSLILGLPLATRLLEGAARGGLPGSIQGLQTLVVETGVAVSERYFYWVGVESTVMALAGFALLVMAFLLPRQT